MRNSFKNIALALALSWSGIASAALVQSNGQITHLRIEGTYGFIAVPDPMAPGASCGYRVWIDMSTPLGRSVWATALLAYNTKQNVIIRAFEESARVFGACGLYDIYMQQ